MLFCKVRPEEAFLQVFLVLNYNGYFGDLQILYTASALSLIHILTEGLFIADFDMNAIRRYRESEMMGNTFRKTEAYRKLLDPAINKPFMRKGQ